MRFPPSPFAIILLLAGALSSAGDAQACKCGAPPSPKAAAAQADAVFTARVVDIRSRGPDRPAVFTLAVLRGWKGVRDGERVVIRRLARVMMCHFYFDAGKEYLVYADRSPDGSLDASLCGRTRLLADAKEDIEVLDHL
jgi:hypothetical protein